MKSLFFILFFIVLISFLSAIIINVPGDQPTIQAGINVAVDSDTVLVQPDTYVENINFHGKGITVGSLFLTTQDTSYISQTIIDGDSIDSVVTFESGEDSTAVITGFTITNGFSETGGGIYCYNNSNPTIEHCTFSGNSAMFGGGIKCWNNSSPMIKNCILSDNWADEYGGGIDCAYWCNPTIEYCIISGNSSELGAGISCTNESNPEITNCTISENSATYHGGGIYCEWTSNPFLSNVDIRGNSAGDHGGGIACGNSSPVLTNVTITDNSVESYGGGISCFSYSNPILLNVDIIGNSAELGGGIYCRSSSNPNLENGTITNNTAFQDGGGIYCSENSNPSLINYILWNNSPQEIVFYGYYQPSSITISYSDVQGGEAGIVTNNNGTVYWLEGNIDEDPLFVGTGGYPFSLLVDSPCIDAGNPDPIYYDPEDPSNPGYALYPAMGTVINDMGAYGGPNTIGWPVVGLDDNVIVQTPEVLLHQNYPNPFNPTTTINYSLKENSKVSLKIYNIKGQKVKTLVNELLPAGEHSIIWDGRDSNGKRVGSGIYFYKITAGESSAMKKMLLLK